MEYRNVPGEPPGRFDRLLDLISKLDTASFALSCAVSDAKDDDVFTSRELVASIESQIKPIMRKFHLELGFVGFDRLDKIRNRIVQLEDKYFLRQAILCADWERPITKRAKKSEQL